jgi:hypothetical protein
MSTYNVKKVAVADSDIGGLKSSRYEKIQVSYGKLSSSSYNILDTLVFSDVPSQDLIRATITAHASPDITVSIYPGVNNTSPVAIGGFTSPVDISYVIEYVRGGGQVGADASGEAGEGSLLRVFLGDISEFTTTQLRALSTAQIDALSTAQVVAFTTTQAASLKTTQVAALNTAQVSSLETQDFAAFTTAELQALETVDVKALTSAELQALNTTQLSALTTTQTAVLTSKQKRGLTTTQLAALQ